VAVSNAVGETEADDDFIEERRIREVHADAAELGARAEDQFVAAGSQPVARKEGFIGSAIGIGDGGLEVARIAFFQDGETNLQPCGRPSQRGIQDVGRQVCHISGAS